MNKRKISFFLPLLLIATLTGCAAPMPEAAPEVSQIIIVTPPARRVFNPYETAFDLGGMTVVLKYSDGSTGAPIEVMGGDFKIEAVKTSLRGELKISKGSASVLTPVLFLDGFDKASGIAGIENLGMITGPASVNSQILSEYGLNYGDLGVTAFDKENNLNYFFYGDTFSELSGDALGGIWRSNYAAVSSDFDFSDGITFDSVFAPVVEGDHDAGNADLSSEVTKIPTGGVVIGGTPYMFYMSVSYRPDRKIRRAECVKLIGDVWVKVHSYCWIDRDAVSFSGDLSFYVTTEADRFKQISACSNSPDGYLYLYATGNGRTTDARLMRILPENFEDIILYEYYCGLSGGAPVWKTAAENGIMDSVAVIDKASTSGSVGELTVTYNPYLQKYMAAYCADSFQSGYQNDYYGLLLRLSDTPYGPFGEIYNIDRDARLEAPGGIYGAFTSEGLFEEGGRIVYLLVSSFTPTYNVQLIKVEFAKK
jgi:hypothetical protein